MIGQTIGGYKILEVLGRGGMGVVFKAVDTALDKVVALKSLDPVHAQSEQFLGRFRSEARTLGRLQHPHIVNVFAFRHVEPHLFIVMEFVDGGSVADLIGERGAVPWQEALPIVRQSLEAMAYAHQASVVHRDIKPRNILLTRGGYVKVTDFGLAKIQESTEEGRGLTRTGITGGTLYYMPPEQLEGLSRVDHRGDIYSLGMTCYELLAGRVPFDKQKSEFTILKAIDAHTFPPIDHFAPEVPKPLAEIVTKALEHDPEDRFQTADAMLEALDAWSSGTATAPAGQDTTRVFQWAAPPPVTSPPAPPPEPADEEAVEASRSAEEPREKSRGDSSSLLKSLKLLLKDQSGNWRVSGGEREDDEPLDAGEPADPALQATVIAPAPLKAPRSLTKEPAQRRERAPSRVSSERAPARVESPRARRWLRPVLFVSVVAAVAAAIFLLYPSVGPEAEPTMGPSEATLSIRTTPSEADVSLNGRPVGTTPLMDVEAPAGEHVLRVTKSGFAPLDTAVTLRAGGAPALTLVLSALEAPGAVAENVEADAPADEATNGAADAEAVDAEAAATGTATLRSTPSGAEVWLDGRRIGTTPHTAHDLSPGTHRVEFRRDGYETHATSVRVTAGATATAAPTLTPLRGTLRVLVRPYGDIYVDGERKRSESVAPHVEELPAGTYRVRAVHPVLGTWEKDVAVRGGDRREVLFDFRQTYRVTVVSEPRNAAIVVDGEPIGRNTPSQIALRPGRHTIEVRKDGYVMAGRPQTITVERDRTDDPLSFELRAR